MGGDGAGGFGLRTSISAIVGGTASAIGGGKFSNGAIGAAFVHMFNAEYKTLKEAAQAALNNAMNKSLYLGRELAGYLYKVGA